MSLANCSPSVSTSLMSILNNTICSDCPFSNYNFKYRIKESPTWPIAVKTPLAHTYFLWQSTKGLNGCTRPMNFGFLKTCFYLGKSLKKRKEKMSAAVKLNGLQI